MFLCTTKFFLCCPKNANNVKINTYNRNIQRKAIVQGTCDKDIATMIVIIILQQCKSESAIMHVQNVNLGQL